MIEINDIDNLKTIVFDDGELQLNVSVNPQKDTVWLNRQQMSVLYDRDVKTIGKHIVYVITLMVAESKPDEKEIMIALIMNFLQK